MSPAALAAVMTLFTGASRGTALGAWSALAGAGSALGVVLGGVLTSEAGWRWVFTINEGYSGRPVEVQADDC
jgi:MFS family permease